MIVNPGTQVNKLTYAQVEALEKPSTAVSSLSNNPATL
jgi:hypothetical protein